MVESHLELLWWYLVIHSWLCASVKQAHHLLGLQFLYLVNYHFLLHLCEGCLMFRSQVERYFVLWQLSNWFCKLWQSQWELKQIINHANKWLYLLFVGWWRHGCYSQQFASGWLATTCSIGLTKEFYLILLVLQLVIIQFDIALLGCL